jgi:putative heme-binding domain-containing protein
VSGNNGVPVVTAFEFLRNTSNNSWGVGISEDGQLFGSTANGNPSMHLPVANRYYERVRGWSSSVLGMISPDAHYEPATDKVRQVDHHGNFTSAAGHALYTARKYPREYWNRTAFVSDPTGHLTSTFVLQPEGASFRSQYSWNLVASDDEWSGPIMAEVGPDGNMWVIDWYNFIVQHNPTPAGYQTGKGNAYETPLRDKQHGRIYRVVYHSTPSQANSRSQATSHSQAPPGNAVGEAPPRVTGRAPATLGEGTGDATRSVAEVRSQAEPGNEEPGNESDGPSLADASPEQLVEALRDPNMFWRLHAQRLLVERGNTDVVPALVELARDDHVDEVGLNAPVVHAMWALHGLRALDGSHEASLNAAVEALDHASSGVRRNAVLVLPHTTETAGTIVSSGILNDSDPQVRLAALLALADTPAADEGDAAVSGVLRALDDPANLRDQWLVDAATSAAAGRSGPFLRAIAGRRFERDPHENLTELVARVAEHFARSGQADELPALVAALPESHEQIAVAIVEGLSRGWPRDSRPELDEPAEQALVKVVTKLPSSARGQLVALAAGWGSQALEKYAAEIAATYIAQLEDENSRDADRSAAAAQLVEFRPGDLETVAKLLDMISPRTSPELSTGLLEAVGRSQAADGGAAVAERLGEFTPGIRPVAIRVLLGRSEWTESLLEALQDGTLRPSDLSLDQQQALAAHPDRRLAARFRRLLESGGGLPNPDRQKVIEELMPLTERMGDVAAGKEVFTKQCAKCHTHSGEGTKIGPDLTGMAVHPKAELLTQLIDPSRSVEGNYRMYTVATEDGRVFNGLLASETRTAIELFDTEGKKHVVLREDIDELVASPKSLMPEGFEKQVPPEDVVNLLAFLTARGKYLPLPLEKVATIASDRSMFVSENAPAERLIFPDWKPKMVDGIPFVLVDPEGGRKPNVILLHSEQGRFPPQMPRSVKLPVNAPAAAIHLLSGVSGWGHPYGEQGAVSMIVRLHYADGETEDHPLRNGEHFADYIRRVDVPGSEFAFDLRGRQIRYLAVEPERDAVIQEIEFVKGPDRSAPVVMAVTVESRSES